MISEDNSPVWIDLALKCLMKFNTHMVLSYLEGYASTEIETESRRQQYFDKINFSG